MQIITNPEYDNNLKAIALEFGFTYRGNPSPTNLINAIAEGSLKVIPNKASSIPYYLAILKFIEKKQSFKIYYLDASGEPFSFTAQYAEIAEHEGKPYLDIWFAEEFSDCEYYPLRHNRCLRIDRIPSETTLEPVDLPWKESGLDAITIEFELFDNLAFAYSKNDSDVIEWLDLKHIKIQRQVTNLFWLKRKLLQYIPNLKINSPKDFKDKFYKEIYDFLNQQT